MSDYTARLKLVIAEWGRDPIADEWVFERFREETVSSMVSSDAFDAIEPTINVLLGERDMSTKTELLQTILNLASRSETTEVPRALSRNWEQLKAALGGCDDYTRSKLRELMTYYRVPNGFM